MLSPFLTKENVIHICAYWNCAREIGEDEVFCNEHSSQLNYNVINQCPKCGRYKDSRFDLCPDCQCMRPIPSWKITSRTTEADAEKRSKPRANINRVLTGYEKFEPAKILDKRYFAKYPGDEAYCPLCHSSDITYKNVFDYYKCNDCKNTFMRPDYNRDGEELSGFEPDNYHPAPAISVKPKRERIIEEKAVKADNVKKPLPGSLGFLILLAVTAAVINILLIIWNTLGLQIDIY